MKTVFLATAVILSFAPSVLSAADTFQKDVFNTPKGDLTITFIGHGTLLLDLGGVAVHVDPWSSLADYSRLPAADLILVTHEHRDHLDLEAIDKVRREDSVILANPSAARSVQGSEAIENGETRTVLGLEITAVPAYNVRHKRPDGSPFHPMGAGNGYVISFGSTRIYVAGDTEDIPEMKNLGPVDIAFIPVNLPYTMTPEMAAQAARMIRPKVLYPYHFGETDIGKLADLLKDEKGIEVRIRPMK